jgi:3-hydroxyisobutyrate dehydrogenase
MTTPKTVGFIGLGAMGGALAASVAKGGFDLLVHDLNPVAVELLIAAGARRADSAEQLARESDVVLLSLPMPADVEAVCIGPQGIFGTMRAGTACFDMSTNAPDTLQRLRGQANARGIHFLDAPVSGGAAGAKARRLVIWVGGDVTIFEAHRDVLEAIGDRVQHMGELGTATVAKLVINMAASGIGCVLSEAMTLGVKGGLDPLELWQAMRSSALGRMKTFDALGHRFLTGEVNEASFALRLAHKDSSLALGMASDLGVPMRMCNLALAEMTEAMARGWGNRDVWSAMTLQPERAGVEFRVSRQEVDKVANS